MKRDINCNCLECISDAMREFDEGFRAHVVLDDQVRSARKLGRYFHTHARPIDALRFPWRSDALFDVEQDLQIAPSLLTVERVDSMKERDRRYDACMALVGQRPGQS